MSYVHLRPVHSLFKCVPFRDFSCDMDAKQRPKVTYSSSKCFCGVIVYLYGMDICQISEWSLKFCFLPSRLTLISARMAQVVRVKNIKEMPTRLVAGAKWSILPSFFFFFQNGKGAYMEVQYGKPPWMEAAVEQGNTLSNVYSSLMMTLKSFL